MMRFLMVSIAMCAAAMSALAAVVPVRAQSPNPALLAPSGALPGLAPPAPTIPGQHSGIPLSPSGRVGGPRYVQVPGSARTVMIPEGPGSRLSTTACRPAPITARRADCAAAGSTRSPRPAPTDGFAPNGPLLPLPLAGEGGEGAAAPALIVSPELVAPPLPRTGLPVWSGPAGKARQQHRHDAGEEDAVEGPGAADRGDRRAEPAHGVEIEEVGPDQCAEAAGNIGERRARARGRSAARRGR